jgi:hypothetical protein
MNWSTNPDLPVFQRRTATSRSGDHPTNDLSWRRGWIQFFADF